MKTKKIKTVDVSLPKTKDDLRIIHARACTNPQFQIEGIKLDGKLAFLSRLLNKSKQFIGTFDIGDLNEMFYHAMKIIGQMDIMKDPPKKLEVNGVMYELVDMKRPPTSWVMDTEGSDFDRDPVRLACICYIPEGTRYGDLDENENMKHPIEERYQDFVDHFPLEHYARLNAFFLKLYERSARRYIAEEQAKRVTNKILSVVRSSSTTGS